MNQFLIIYNNIKMTILNIYKMIKTNDIINNIFKWIMKLTFLMISGCTLFITTFYNTFNNISINNISINDTIEKHTILLKNKINTLTQSLRNNEQQLNTLSNIKMQYDEINNKYAELLNNLIIKAHEIKNLKSENDHLKTKLDEMNILQNIFIIDNEELKTQICDLKLKININETLGEIANETSVEVVDHVNEVVDHVNEFVDVVDVVVDVDVVDVVDVDVVDETFDDVVNETFDDVVDVDVVDVVDIVVNETFDDVANEMSNEVVLREDTF